MAANRHEGTPLSRRRVLTVGGAALAAVFGLSGCAQDDALAKQAKAGDNKNYVAGDGSVTEFAAADRKSAVSIKGTLFDGTTVEPAPSAVPLVVGARVPIALTSRADSVRSRLVSAAIAKLVAHAASAIQKP